MTRGFVPVGPYLFCFIRALPQSRLQSVEKMKVLGENSGGRASQETFPIGVGRRAFQTEGRGQVKARCVQ